MQSFQEDQMNQISALSSSCGNCGHWLVPDVTCLVCKTNQTLLKDHQALDYLFSGLSLSDESVTFTKRFTTLTSLYVHKKLHLVLDLDHTLVHSIHVSDLSEAEKYLIDDDESGSRKKLQKENILIQFRPFLTEFLKEANKLFIMYVYTKASPAYAHGIVKMMDPDKTYFGDRVITSQESPNEKTLDLVLADERGILIVDDSVEVWPDHKRNLLKITRYFYFKHGSCNNKSSYAERKMNESRSRGALANLLKYLKNIHSEFFSCELDEELDSKDVRLLINGPFKPKGC